MRKFLFLTSFIILIFIMTSCTQIAISKNEINEVIYARIFSIDKGDNNNFKVTITARNLSSQQSDNNSNTLQQSYNISSEGKTMFEAVRNLCTYTDKRPFYGHNEFILISEEAAKEGIFKYIDFISRYYQFRPNSRIYIVKGTSAYSLIENTSSNNLSIDKKLHNLERDIVGLSISSEVTISEAMIIFDNPEISIFIPYIELKNTNNNKSNIKDNFDISLNGYAIFKKDKLDRYLTGNDARGINWIKNRISLGVIIVKGNNGEDISLEIISSHTKIIPKITDKDIYCDIHVDVSTNIDEITAPDDIFNKSSIDYLVMQQEEIIKKEIEKVLSIAQESNLDFLGIIKEFHMQYPIMWKDIEKNWPDLFPKIKFNVIINAKINRTYLIKEPTGTIK